MGDAVSQSSVFPRPRRLGWSALALFLMAAPCGPMTEAGQAMVHARHCYRGPFARGFCIRLASIVAFLLLFAPAAQAGDEGPQSVEFLVYLDGQHVGSARWDWEETHGAERYRAQQVIRVRQRSGQGAMRETAESRRSGPDVYRLSRRQQAGPTVTTTEARIEDGRFEGRGDVLALPAGTILPHALVGRLRAAALEGVTVPHVFVVDPESMSPVLRAFSPCPAPTVGARSGRCVRMAGANRHEDWTFAGDGRLLSVEREFAGMALVLRRCEANCERVVATPFDAIGRLVVASPHKIPKDASQRELRFVISRQDRQAPLIAHTGDQRVAFSGAKAVVSVCRDCGDASVETPATLVAFVEPNAWIQSRDPAVRRLAARVGGKAGDVDSRMHRSMALLAERLKGHFGYIGYADAAQVLRLGKADCTGYAVVLAAMARAQGIPARVVVGMAYADRFSGRREVFSPHAWVQAWDGKRWRSYDAALLDFDSTHVALAVGDGDPNQLTEAFLQLGQLRIERLGVVKPD